MKKRIISFILAATLILGTMLSLSACSNKESQFTKSTIDFSSFEKIASESFMSLGSVLENDKLSIESKPVIKDSEGNETTASILLQQDNKSNTSYINSTFNLDGNDLSLSVINEKNNQFLAVENVLDKPFKIPLSVFSGSDTSKSSEFDIKNFYTSYQRALKNALSSIEIKSEDTTYKVNSVEQVGTKMSIVLQKEQIISFLNEMKEPISKLSENSVFDFILNYFKGLNVLPADVSVNSIDELISSIEKTDVSVEWYKIIRLGKLVEETVTINFGENGKNGKLEFYFNEKTAATYSTGTIELASYDSKANKTSLVKINYTDDDGSVKFTYAIYDLATVTIKNSDTSTKDAESSTTTISVTISAGSSEFSFEINTNDTVKEKTSDKCVVDISSKITSSSVKDFSVDVTAQITANASSEISLEKYADSHCYVLTNDTAGVELYSNFISTLEQKYPTLKDKFPKDFSLDANFINQDVIANIYGSDVSVSPYLYTLQNNRDYYESYFASNEEGKNFAELLKTYDVNGKILSDYITDKSKDDFLLTYIIGKKFDELGLQLSFTELYSISNSLKTGYTPEVIEKLNSQFGLSEANLRYILATKTKQQKINDYYFGENGISKITDEELNNIYSSDFLGVRFILMQKTSVEGTAFTDEEMAAKKAQLEDILNKINSGEITFEDAILKNSDMCYSEDEYNQYPDYKDVMDESNKKQTEGYTINKSGISDLDQTQFSKEVTDKLISMNIGDYAVIQDSYGLWLIQKIEKPTSLDAMKDIVKDYSENNKMNALIEEWEAASNCIFNNDTVLKYNVNNLTKMFS